MTNLPQVKSAQYVCEVMYPAGYIEIHASVCGERFVHEHKEFANIQPLLIGVISKEAVIGWLNWYLCENMLSTMYLCFTKFYFCLLVSVLVGIHQMLT